MRTLTVVLLLAAAAPAAKENLLPNGGFEKGMEGWVFLGNSGNTRQDLDRQVKKEGDQSLHLKKTGGPPFDVPLDLAGIEYHPSHDASWWLAWWERNRQRYPGLVLPAPTR